LTIQDASLGRASDALSDLKQKIIEGMALGEVGQLMERVGETFDTVKQSLNMALGGRFLFAGAVDDRPPVTADSPDALIGQPLGSAFEPDLRQGFVQIDETRVIATGPLASDLADQAMQAFQALAEANAGPDGPFNGRPTQAQTDALQAVLQQLDGAFETVLQAQGQNGSALAAAELAVTQQSARADTLSGIISEKTDVDLSEAAVKITQAQLQFQASAQAFNTVRGMSLLDFLR
jgi:flagellar hook-associated protein 3 FlgL